MKILKTLILTSIVAFCCFTTINAQENARGKSKGKVVLTGRPGSLSVSGGATDEAAAKSEISCPQGTTMTNGRCVPDELIKAKWLDLETGQIKYFEYTEDTPIDNAAVCKALGVDACIILKGKYPVDRSGSGGGKITLRIQPIKWVNRPPIPTERAFAFEGTNPKGQDCKGFGNSCWFLAYSPKDAQLKTAKLPYFITPIVTQEVCKTLVLQYDKGGAPAQPEF